MELHIPFWSSLRLRVVLGVVVPLIIALGLAAQLQYANHRALMLENLQESLALLGESVETSLTRAMLSRDRAQLAQVAADLARRESIRNVMILDHDGMVRVASRASEVGQRVSPNDPACADCHASGAYAASRSFVFTTTEGARVFRSVTPILNQLACQSCHDRRARLNGILIIDLPIEPIEAHLWSDLRQNLILAVATVILVTLAINLLLNRIVLTKLERFGAALKHYARGDFGARVAVTGGDEIGALAAAVNGMARGLEEKQKLEREVERSAQQLERESAMLGALYRVALESSRSLNLEAVMQAGLDNARAVMGMEAGEIHLLEPGGQNSLRLRAFVGSAPEFVREEELLCRGECLCGSVAARGQTSVIGDLGPDARVTRLACRRFGFRAVAAVPLRARGRTLGVLTLHQRAAREFLPDDIALLSALGDQLGIAIDNAQLYTEMESRVNELSRQLQHLAILEERDRLAREIHDGFAQALALLNLKLRMVQTARGSDAELAAALAEMRALVDETYQDVRQAIGDLRTPLASASSMVNGLADYVQNFGLRYNLDAEVVVEPAALEVRCSPDVEIQVMRIVQEALANVRKHARARQVRVTFEQQDGHLEISIRDDGQGFDPAATADAPSRKTIAGLNPASRRDGASARTTGHFGLAIMRERAASFGGNLKLNAQPGAGTSITFRVPLTNSSA